METPTAMKTFDLTVARQIPANPEAVFDAWFDRTNEASMWEGAQELILEPAEGKLFYWVVGHEGKTYHHYGLFRKLVRGSAIEHTWMAETTMGLESTVSISFKSKDGGTYLTLTHSGLPDDEEGRKHEAGWTSIVAGMVDFFEAKIPVN